jgi:flagellar biosynthesis GTPase FlhF
MACVVGFTSLLFVPFSFSNKVAAAPEISMELPSPEADVLAVVQTVVDDHVIRGTYVYEKEKTLNEAVAETSSAYFGPWKDPGHVFYKVRRGALSPRNFKDSSDIGVITVRYVVRPTSASTTRLMITAVFVEDGTHRVHVSDSTVETSEFAEIQKQLTEMQRDRQLAAETRQQRDLEAQRAADLARQQSEEAARVVAEESSLKTLERRADELQHAVEVRVLNPATELKSAPFHGATTLVKLSANSDVLVEIVTAYWYGVETIDGHRGWIRRDQVAPLP